MNTKRIIQGLGTALLLAFGVKFAKAEYQPSPEIVQAQEEFADSKFGVFFHWGLYSMFGQGEWYLNYGPKQEEYVKAAKGFYPSKFDAKAWVKAVKDAGAKYICFTSRHHEGFSMWDTDMSDYNIVDATPFGRDVLKELAEECQRQGIKLHLYYSHIDWGREDYPRGRTGLDTGVDLSHPDWKGYYDFMNGQLKELLTNYGPIGAIWFDGWWDHDEDKTPFDWELPAQYQMIHDLQPSCLVANNHHQTPFEGDLPGENAYGLSGQAISQLPLETCATMNGMWGYKIADQNYKDPQILIHMLVGAASKGANLLLNVGPQPSWELPATALNRLAEMGKWLNEYGETIYGTRRGDFPAQSWGTSTRKGNLLFVHVLEPEAPVIYVPVKGKVKKAYTFKEHKKVKFNTAEEGILLDVGKIDKDTIDYVVVLETTKL
ncbi:MAG: alpha-L-fucosidase [Bacteroides sp.]|nr:alpha-L-fucosidase [Bacteroides sp.]